MPEPRFLVGQRLYNSKNTYHGKVLRIFLEAESEGWFYTMAWDLPNRLNLPSSSIPEEWLTASFDESMAIQETEKQALANGPWNCCSGVVEGDQCPDCKETFAKVFPDLAPYRKLAK